MKNHRILAVDDNAINLTVVREALTDDYDVRTAENASQALSLLDVFQPDIILLDIMMPGMNGYELCEYIRNDQRFHNIKIIMVSAKAMISERLEGYKKGADDYITKPFDPHELHAKVRAYLRLKSVEEVNDLKNNALNLLSYNTGTPMTTILGVAHTLYEDLNAVKPEYQQLVRDLYDDTNKLKVYIDQVKTLTQLKSSSDTLSCKNTNLQTVLQNACDSVRSRYHDRNLHWQTDLFVDVTASLDLELFTQALTAVLDNAARLTPPDGSVLIKARHQDHHAAIKIVDQGPGLPPHIHSQIFSPLPSRDNTRQQNGSGLSLALAQEILRHHQGYIEAENNPDHGAAFTIHLPLHAHAPSQHQPQTACV